jgi:hypothetical protein
LHRGSNQNDPAGSDRDRAPSQGLVWRACESSNPVEALPVGAVPRPPNLGNRLIGSAVPGAGGEAAAPAGSQPGKADYPFAAEYLPGKWQFGQRLAGSHAPQGRPRIAVKGPYRYSASHDHPVDSSHGKQAGMDTIRIHRGERAW